MNRIAAGREALRLGDGNLLRAWPMRNTFLLCESYLRADFPSCSFSTVLCRLDTWEPASIALHAKDRLIGGSQRQFGSDQPPLGARKQAASS